jgi:hypothetical protein
VTRNDVIEDVLESAKAMLLAYFGQLPPHSRMRLDGIEAEIGALQQELGRRIWDLVLGALAAAAEQQAGCCPGCGRRCSRDPQNVSVVVRGQTVEVPVVYYYCRRCHRGQAPLRQWLGIHDGSASGSFARALVSLCLLRSFGDGAKEMKEQHGQEVDRTRAERVTYQVAKEAQQYLQERLQQDLQRARSIEGATQGVERLTLTADGGAVPVGTLVRPPLEQATEFTEKRKLPKGKREQTHREVRLISVHQPAVLTERVMDIHVAPHDHPEVSGERMYVAALRAGLGDHTWVHGVFDMGTWIRLQFQEQFPQKQHTACADIFHVDEYLGEAAHCLFPGDPQQRKDWLSTLHQWLKDSDHDLVVQQLLVHQCRPGCRKDDRGDCLVQVALRYLEHFADYMDYARFIREGLPIGSGEAEGAIRHWIRRRLDVPGVWREDHVQSMCALLTLKASGWWEDFWRWRDQRDIKEFQLRLEGQLKATVFRGAAGRQGQAAPLSN